MRTAITPPVLAGALPALVIAASALSVMVEAGSDDSAPVDFVRQVRPILSQHCFACHGPDEHARRADLSLLTHASATAELAPGVRAVTPGDRAASALWQRINDLDDPMPPRDQHNALGDEQIQVLGRWIDQGASYAPHWAYVAPRATPVPDVVAGDWPVDDIDRWILARLEAEGLPPAPDADRVTLLRRLAYDLTGLPPATADLDAFLADDGDDALATAVDRLLERPHFGERMATFWLDLVRYADTVGYHGDQEHHAWPYRDWVIGAFNANMSFDRFTIEQLAGDLTADPGQDQLIASGYNRLLQTTHEGGLQLAEYRAIYMADRVRNASEAWMGATMGCAECHDHKYDPYTARDFYAFGAFFADIDDEAHLRKPYDGLNTTPTRRSPEMRVTSAASRARARDIAARLEAAAVERDAALAALPDERGAWEQSLRDAIAAGRPTETEWVDDRLETGGRTQGAWAFGRIEGVPPVSGDAYRTQTGAGIVQHYTVGTTRRAITIAEGDVLFAWVRLAEHDAPTAVMLQFNVGGAWEHRAVWGDDAITYGRRDESWAGYRRRGARPEPGRWVRLEVAPGDVGIAPGQVVTGMAFTQHGGTAYWDKAGVTSNQPAPAAVIEALAVAPADRTDAQRAAVAEHHAASTPAVRSSRARIGALRDELAALESSLPLTMYTRGLDAPRPVRVLPRGNWLDESGPLVVPAIPAFLGRLDVGSDRRATRLDLARWLVTPEARGGAGGMTARVFVNRVWAMLFGEGMCPSTEDFGGQGLPPNHLELLDRLSLDFIASGWDVKALVRRLVLTRTYRQSSVPRDDVLRRDPLNHLFARQTRRRLPAEMVRDTALAVSGLLVDRRGGPSVKPPQPAGYYRHLNFPTREYEPDTGDGQWRRGVYVHWQRQYVHPMLRAFDAPSREQCTARRGTSNSPLAALALMNDPSFVEASRAFAQRILTSGPAGDTAAIAFAMREATGRRPSAREVAVLIALLDDSRRHYAERPADATALLSVGAAPRDAALDLVQHAAWTQVARAILNLHETITRE